MGSEAFVAARRQSLGNVCVQDARRSTRVCRRLSAGPERRSTISAGFTGQSRPHFRQHHVMIAARPLMVVSSAMEPTAAQKMQRAGTVNFSVDGADATLLAFHQGDALFIPFRDATSGKDTYGAGRYVEAEALGGGRYLLDFNHAYNPYCAYNDDWRCPLPPAENWLKVAIRAGEKSFH